jgi:hypothetical protein
MEASSGVGLGRPVERPLQFSDRVNRGGSSHAVALTQPFPVRDAWTKQRPFPCRRLCCPSGSIGTMAASDALPARRPLPGSAPVIGRRLSGGRSRVRRAGEGLPSSRRHRLNVPRPLRREVLGGCSSRLFTPSVAFALKDRARLFLSPTAFGGHSNGAAGFASMLRTAQSLPRWGS